jgi:ATPase subunit of ABC transporter with duplicated ATPase domains
VIGPNGAGKTTLFRMLTGQEQPDSGTLTIGETVQLGYVDQSRDTLDPNKTVWEEISGGNDIIYLGKHEMNSAPIARRSTSRAATSSRRWARSRAASATACIWPRS